MPRRRFTIGDDPHEQWQQWEAIYVDATVVELHNVIDSGLHRLSATQRTVIEQLASRLAAASLSSLRDVPEAKRRDYLAPAGRHIATSTSTSLQTSPPNIGTNPTRATPPSNPADTSADRNDNMSQMAPDQLTNIKLKRGNSTVAELLSVGERFPHLSKERVAWEARIASRLVASGYRTLNDVPEAEFAAYVA